MSVEEGSVSSEGGQVPMRQKHKGGKVNMFEPQDNVYITTSPMILTCFQNVGCFRFCENIKQVKSHAELTRFFVLNLHKK